MNYIKEMNAFFTQLQVNALSSSAIALWSTLMNINNKAGWKKEFTVAATLLRSIAGLSEGAFKRARIELQDKGYIVWKTRGGNQAAVYEMVSLSSLIDYKSNDDNQDHTDMKESNKDIHSIKKPESSTGTIPSHKEEDGRSIPLEAVEFYQENFEGELAPFIKTEMNNSISMHGDALVLEAMKRAVTRNKANWGYVKSILQAWRQKGITSVAEARQELNGKEVKKQKQSKYKQHNKAEIIPKWFKERHLQPALNPSHATNEKVDAATLLEEYKRQKQQLV